MTKPQAKHAAALIAASRMVEQELEDVPGFMHSDLVKMTEARQAAGRKILSRYGFPEPISPVAAASYAIATF